MHSHEMTIALARQHQATQLAEAEQYRRLAGTRPAREPRPVRRASRLAVVRSLGSTLLTRLGLATRRTDPDVAAPSSAVVTTSQPCA